VARRVRARCRRHAPLMPLPTWAALRSTPRAQSRRRAAPAPSGRWRWGSTCRRPRHRGCCDAAGFASQAAGRHVIPPQGGLDALDEVCNHGTLESTSRYALQGLKAYPHRLPLCYHRRMERTEDERREILRAFIGEKGLKIAKWAKCSGVDKNSIYNFLNGHSRSLDPRTYAKLARTAEVPVHALTGDMPDPPSPTTIWVVGTVEAGAFVDAVEWDQSRWYAVDVPVPARFRKRAKALEVRGPSMNLEYPEGSIVVWVDALDFRPARDGDHVIAYSYAERRHDRSDRQRAANRRRAPMAVAALVRSRAPATD
jgi:SOS-response transcriptional repressor LexA